MKYYAVTDDPNELMHYGVLGMKWGVVHDKPRHPGSGRRSSAYKRAQGKLGKMMRSGIKKAEASWKAYNSPEAKGYRAYKKYQKQTDRALEQARKGKLKYGKLSDEQVQRVTQRLAMERDARMLSETEKTWGKRLRESIGEGVISGIGQGFGRRTSEWISRGSTLKTDRMRKELQGQMDLDQQRREIMQRYDLERKHELDQMRNARKDARVKAQNQVDEEYYVEAAKRGYKEKPNARALLLPGQANRERAQRLQSWQDYDEAKDRNREIEKTYYRTYATEHAKNQAKLAYNNQTAANKSKKDKKDKKEKNKGNGQPPVSINIYAADGSVRRANPMDLSRPTNRDLTERERSRRIAKSSLSSSSKPKTNGSQGQHYSAQVGQFPNWETTPHPKGGMWAVRDAYERRRKNGNRR